MVCADEEKGNTDGERETDTICDEECRWNNNKKKRKKIEIKGFF